MGPRRAALLEKLGIRTVEDLLKHFPRSYHDRRQITRIADLKLGERVTIRAEVVSTDVTYLRRRMCLAKALLKDASGTVWAAWFNQPYMTRVMQCGLTAFFTGEVIKYGGLQLRNPEYEFVPETEQSTIHTGRIVPVYGVTEGISQRQMRAIMWEAVDNHASRFSEMLPADTLARHNFPRIDVALRNVHFPENASDQQISRRRCAFEELFEIQLSVLSEKNLAKRETNRFRMVTDGPCVKKLKATLPFELTEAQERAVERILADVSSETVMNMLLQGDVGCGKTVVALHAIAATVAAGYQAAIMAPTEILAAQHYHNVEKYLVGSRVKWALLVGGLGAAERRKVLRRIRRGEADIVIGTHALIQQDVAFARLGLVVVDEQHKF
ncbi:MAG: DEAD/DEAH box helicase, partial [Candidatus Hydrogenedentes bacterium]|nr:DEAD/DEAH box helicase [Candidatus Hydrogenedentota bacterium]